MIRIVCALAACLLLTGCATATHRDAFPTRYTLAPAPAARAVPAPGPGAATLRIDRIAVPAWLQGTAMLYRLDYRNPAVVAAYADSEWAAPPAELLAQRLRDTLAGAGGWRAVVGPSVSTPATLEISVRLDEFSQVFVAPQRSAGVLDATVTLTADPDGQVIAQRRFHIRVPAQRADAAGGVAALGRASRAFADRLAAWLRSAVPSR